MYISISYAESSFSLTQHWVEIPRIGELSMLVHLATMRSVKLHEVTRVHSRIKSTQLEGEEPLVPKAFHVVDGNYSYKRAANAGLVDQRIFEGDYVIPRAQVNKFQYEVKSRAKERSAVAEGELESDDEEVVGDAPWVGLDAPGDSADGQEIETPCAKNWRAAQEKQSALAIYEINGGFPTACRHGLIEAFCEIVRSGEL